eukprot:m.464148 g.464148  ORF g.464148 m.464148 type:complete len:316 (-) comp20356_c1_seq2:56-1003(-)
MHRRRGGRAPGLPLLLLGMQVMRMGVNTLGAVTLSVLVVNVFVHLNPANVPLPLLHDVCIGSAAIWYHGELHRLVLAPFYHLSDMHLYYNMSSWLWKARQLEGPLGSEAFASMVAILTLLSSSLMVVFDVGSVMTGFAYAMPNTCAAGFSGVLFALKVVVHSANPEGTVAVMGFPLVAKWAAWAELLVIHMLVPGSSFVGHLCGIFAGLLYVHVPPLARRFLPSFGSLFQRQSPRRRYDDVVAATGERPTPTVTPQGNPGPEPVTTVRDTDPQPDGRPTETPAERDARVRAARLARFGVTSATASTARRRTTQPS